METLERSRPEATPRETTWRRVRMLLIGLALLVAAGVLDAVLRSWVPPPRPRLAPSPDARPVEARPAALAPRRVTIPR
ncbi:MAG TPA: hypothetical protein VFQ38_21735 [Longimicrobiales bacterium]|nr:hypothetical protein [Longimicrobiales bacterium]